MRRRCLHAHVRVSYPPRRCSHLVRSARQLFQALIKYEYIVLIHSPFAGVPASRSLGNASIARVIATRDTIFQVIYHELGAFPSRGIRVESETVPRGPKPSWEATPRSRRLFPWEKRPSEPAAIQLPEKDSVLLLVSYARMECWVDRSEREALSPNLAVS